MLPALQEQPEQPVFLALQAVKARQERRGREALQDVLAQLEETVVLQIRVRLVTPVRRVRRERPVSRVFQARRTIRVRRGRRDGQDAVARRARLVSLVMWARREIKESQELPPIPVRRDLRVARVFQERRTIPVPRAGQGGRGLRVRRA